MCRPVASGNVEVAYYTNIILGANTIWFIVQLTRFVVCFVDSWTSGRVITD